MPDEVDRGQSVHLITAKPVLFVANVDEGEQEVPEAVRRHADAIGAGAVAVSSRLEAELSELDDEDAAAMRADLGAGESGLERVVRGRVRAPAAQRVLHRRRRASPPSPGTSAAG